MRFGVTGRRGARLDHVAASGLGEAHRRLAGVERKAIQGDVAAHPHHGLVVERSDRFQGWRSDKKIRSEPHAGVASGRGIGRSAAAQDRQSWARRQIALDQHQRHVVGDRGAVARLQRGPHPRHVVHRERARRDLDELDLVRQLRGANRVEALRQDPVEGSRVERCADRFPRQDRRLVEELHRVAEEDLGVQLLLARRRSVCSAGRAPAAGGWRSCPRASRVGRSALRQRGVGRRSGTGRG